jgi:hypothetical protein
MDIKITKALLTELSSVGISQMIVDPVDGGTQFRGTNDNRSLILFDTIDESLTDMAIGIKSINALLSRINLFDEDKAKIELTANNDGFCHDIIVKQGRKRVSYRCHEPDTKVIQAPKHIPGNFTITEENAIMFNKDYVSYLSSAISAMAYTGDKEERSIKVSANEGIVTVSIFDGSDDSFVDVVEGFDEKLKLEGVFDVAPFSRVMKQSVNSPSNDGHTVFTISEQGVGVFRLEYMDILVHPSVS